MHTRPDLYTAVHKGLRALLFDALLLAQRTDLEDGQDVSTLARRVRSMLRLFEVHLVDEDRVLHPALLARCPEVVQAAAGHHREQAAQAALVEATLESVEVQPTVASRAAFTEALTHFVLHGLEHMRHEEEHHTPALWATHTDEELHALHGAIVGHIAPDDMVAFQRCILPAVSHPERVAMLAGMKATAPAAVFEGTMRLAAEVLDRVSFAKLEGALRQVSPTPGFAVQAA